MNQTPPGTAQARGIRSTHVAPGFCRADSLLVPSSASSVAQRVAASVFFGPAPNFPDGCTVPAAGVVLKSQKPHFGKESGWGENIVPKIEIFIFPKMIAGYSHDVPATSLRSETSLEAF